MFLKDYSLMNKMIIPMIAIFIIGLIILIFYISHITERNTLESAIANAKANINQFKQLRGYYTKNVISVVKKQGVLKINFDHKNHDDTIPLPATMIHDLSALMKKKGGIQLKLYSDFPFPNREMRELDKFAKKALKHFRNRSKEAYVEQDRLKSGQQVVSGSYR